MKKISLNVILTAVSIFLLCFAFWINDPLNMFVSTYESSAPLIKSLDFNKIKKISIRKDDKDILIFSRGLGSGNSWLVREKESEAEYLANITLLEQGFSNLEGIKKYQKVSSNKKNHSKFDVDKSGLTVSFFISDSDKPVLLIHLGQSGKNFNTTLVRLHLDDSVYSAKGNLKSDWDQGIDYFRDKSLIDLVPENVDYYALSGAQNYSITKNKLKEWEVTEKAGGIAALAKQDKVKNILQKICDLEASSFKGLTKPLAKEYANIDLMLADKSKVSVIILGPDTENMYFIKTSQRAFWASVAKWKVDNIVVKLDEIKDKKEKEPKIPVK